MICLFSLSPFHAVGVLNANNVVEKGSKYILTHTGPREFDRRSQRRAWVGVLPGSFRGDCDRESLYLY